MSPTNFGSIFYFIIYESKLNSFRFFFFFLILGPEGTKNRKFSANTAITRDLIQRKRMYGELDARLAHEVIPCKMRPETAWNMSLNNNRRVSCF